MCLDTVDKETKKVTEGWKIFRVINDKFFGLFQILYFETNKWIKDSPNHFIELNKNTKYKTGFHFYLDKEEAETDLKTFISPPCLIILPIKVRNVVATGIQFGFKIGVAREIFIKED